MTAHKSSNILVFGATGLIGEHIIKAILESKSHFERIGIFTSSNTLWTKSEEIDALKAEGVEVHAGVLTSESDLEEAFSGYDTIVSCVGRPVIHHQLKLIEVAEKHPDVKRFIPSEYGTDIEYGPDSATEKPHQQKLKVRARLAAARNLEHTYVVSGPYGDGDPGLYLSAAPAGKEQTGTFDVARKKAVLLGDGTGKISLSTMRDVGRFVVGALRNPENCRNRAIKVNSFTTTPHEIVAEFQRQTGGQPWETSYTNLTQLSALEQQAWTDESPIAGVLTLRRIWTEGGTLYDSRDNKLIGLEDDVDTLSSAVARAIVVQSRHT